MFDENACLTKAIEQIHESVSNGADLIVFPELFIPGYQFGMNFGFTTGSSTKEGREDWKRYYDNSIENHVYLSMGYSEWDVVSGKLYSSNIMIAPDGTALNHRKLKQTGSERVVWGDTKKDYFPALDTPWGLMGNLICWESYMPLARIVLHEKGISIYISPNTNDNEEWQNTIRHIAIEGHCYFINCDMLIRKSSYPEDLNEYAAIDLLPERVCRGGSCVIDPYGHLVSDCVWDEKKYLCNT